MEYLNGRCPSQKAPWNTEKNRVLVITLQVNFLKIREIKILVPHK